MLKQLCEDLGIEISKTVSVGEKLEMVNAILELPTDQLESLKKEKRSPAWLVMICGAILSDIKKGKMVVLSELMDRVIGRPLQAVRLQEEAGSETDKKDLGEWTDYEILEEERRLKEILGDDEEE